MKSFRTKPVNSGRLLGDGGALVLAIWLATAIASPAQTFTTLASFNGSNGRNPQATLVQGRDGNLYGTAMIGGADKWGTVFKLTRAGKVTRLYNFCSQRNCADGKNGYAGLVQATDCNLYGTTQTGGASGYGTVFKITRAGKLTTLYSFCSQNICADGEEPFAGLVQATDGNFYGTTFYGGAINGAGGTVFKITPAGKLTTLYSFCSQSKCADGQQPHAGLVQATDGNLYGTTSAGGAYKWGTVFSLSTGLSPFVTFVRTSGKVGQTAQILGQGLTGTTAVSFNGTAASFVVHSDTYLTATIPSGASTGYVTVTTPSGTLKSKVRFRVIP